MQRWHASHSFTTASPRLLLQRAAMVLLLVTALSLIAFSRAQNEAIAAARMATLERLAPVFSLLARPVESWHQASGWVDGVMRAHTQNQWLKNENDTLRHWQSVALALKAENQALRGLMQYQPVSGATYISAKVTGDLGGPFSHNLLINAGSVEGVKPYQAVVDAHGLLGRVMTTAPHSAQVMLITDVSSRVPVIAADSRDRGILVGTGGGMMQLSFLSPSHRVKVGDMIVTTEDGGLMPPSIITGTVFSIKNGTVLVRPTRPVADPEFIRIVQHRLPD
jgi:rod shape-determining protein MreC